MENKEAKIKIDFIRHGAHDQSDPNIPENQHPLTEKGKNESREMREKIHAHKNQVAGYSGNNLRSLATTAMAMGVMHEEADHQEGIDRAIKQKRLASRPDLLYGFQGNFSEFKKSLGVSPEQKKLFRVVVGHPDQYKKETGSEMTGYKDMREKVAQIILKYSRKYDNWRKISDRYEDETLFRLICANEYFYSCFRYKMTEILFGKGEANKYMEWYEREFERNDDRKTEHQTITVTKEDDIKKFTWLILMGSWYSRKAIWRRCSVAEY